MWLVGKIHGISFPNTHATPPHGYRFPSPNHRLRKWTPQSGTHIFGYTKLFNYWPVTLTVPPPHPCNWVTSALVVSKLSQLTPNYFFKKNNKLNIYKHKNVKQENYTVRKKSKKNNADNMFGYTNTHRNELVFFFYHFCFSVWRRRSKKNKQYLISDNKILFLFHEESIELLDLIV